MITVLPIHVGARDISIHALDPLRIVSGKAREQQHANSANHKVHRARLQEQVDDHRHQQAHHAHDQEGPEARQILLRRVAVKAQAEEGRRDREESLRDRRAGIDRGRSSTSTGPSPSRNPRTGVWSVAVDMRLTPKLMAKTNASGDKDDQPPEMPVAEHDRLGHARGTGEKHRDDARQQHPRRHVIVNRQHVGPQARIAGGARDTDGNTPGQRRSCAGRTGSAFLLLRRGQGARTDTISWIEDFPSRETGCGLEKPMHRLSSPSARPSPCATC